MLEQIKAGEYLNRLPYPIKREFEKFHVKDALGNVVIDSMPVPYDHDECDVLRESWEELKYDVKWITDHEAMDRASLAYQAEDTRLHEKFAQDIAAHFNLTGHPKLITLFALAWEYGHAKGHAVIFEHFSGLVKLVDPIPDLQTRRTKMFTAYSECLLSETFTPNDIADKLIEAAK